VTDSQERAQTYALNEGVRVFRSGDEIRFRKGVWNFNEAVVRLIGQPEPVTRYFGAVYEALAAGGEADAAALGRDQGASPEELAGYVELLENLKRQQFLHSADQRDVTRVVSALLGGNLSGFEQYVGTPRSVLFLADGAAARNAAKSLAAEIGLPLDFLDEATVRELALADLTTRTDAVQYMETLGRFEKLFAPYACVLGCVAAPNLSLLRNLNRVLIQAEKPLILGLIDGPFLCVLSTLATQSGCFECFEQRLLARLEDTVVYHQFVQATAGGAPGGGPWMAPAAHMLTAAVLSEGYLYATLSMLRLAGRIINVYLPLLEIQVQDLLRVPYCPACGFLSKAEMNEMYTSTQRLVSEMLAKVEIEG
jgi:thiazole/oxazole-forming peptide maturase SagC family component